MTKPVPYTAIRSAVRSEREPMIFKRIGQWAQVSDCGHYSVACARVNSAYRFEAWHLMGEAT